MIDTLLQMNHFTKSEALAKLNRIVLTRQDFGIIPGRSFGTVTNLIQTGSDYLLQITWEVPSASDRITDTVDKDQYQTFHEFEPDLTVEQIIEASYAAIDIAKNFTHEEISNLLTAIEKAEEIPKDFSRRLVLSEIDPALVACATKLAADVDEHTEIEATANWAYRMASLPIEDLREKLREYDELLELIKQQGNSAPAKVRIIRNALEMLINPKIAG